eukprot:UN26777
MVTFLRVVIEHHLHHLQLIREAHQLLFFFARPILQMRALFMQALTRQGMHLRLPLQDVVQDPCQCVAQAHQFQSIL